MAKKADTNSTNNRAKFDLPTELKETREGLGLTRAQLARLIGAEEKQVRRVENGEGRADIMVRMMNTLKIELTGLAAGPLLHARLRATREMKRGWSIDRLAHKTGVSAQSIEMLEVGEGSVRDLLFILKALAPRFNRRGGKGGADADKDSRFTDEKTARSLEEAFGRVSLDPCAHPDSSINPIEGYFKQQGQDGLAQPWLGNFVYVNPPFSQLAKWLDKALDEYEKGKIAVLACLIPTRTDTRFFAQALQMGASVFFFGGRLKFRKPDGTIEASKITTMLVVLGSTEEQRNKFQELCEGVWVAAR